MYGCVQFVLVTLYARGISRVVEAVWQIQWVFTWKKEHKKKRRLICAKCIPEFVRLCKLPRMILTDLCGNGWANHEAGNPAMASSASGSMQAETGCLQRLGLIRAHNSPPFQIFWKPSGHWGKP